MIKNETGALIEALNGKDEGALADALTSILSGLSLKFDGNLGSLDDIKESLNFRLVDNSDHQTEQASTDVIISAFLESKRSSVCDTSIRSYYRTLNPFRKKFPLLPTTPQAIEEYLAHFREKRTACGVHVVLKMLYKFASQRYNAPNVMRHVARPHFKEKEPVSLTLDEARCVLDACGNDREFALVHLYLGHGLRLDEACRANVGDIGDGQMLIHGKKRTEYMPLLPETREVILRLAGSRAPGEPVFISNRKRRLCQREIYNTVKAVLARSGIAEGKNGQTIATHTLRKSFATLAFHAGCEGRIIERLLRHRKSDATSIYLSMPIERLRANLEKYSPLRLLNGKSPELQETGGCLK